jgi:hypothetical protein
MKVLYVIEPINRNAKGWKRIKVSRNVCWYSMPAWILKSAGNRRDDGQAALSTAIETDGAALINSYNISEGYYDVLVIRMKISKDALHLAFSSVAPTRNCSRMYH